MSTTDPSIAISPGGLSLERIGRWLRQYGVLVLLVVLFVALSLGSDAFLSSRNLLNILNQNTPLAIIAMAGTLVIIAGGFDLSTGSMFGVASVTAAWVAVNVDPVLGLVLAPLVGLALGTVNGLVITGLKVHSFLATIASSLVYGGLAILITGGFLISVPDASFASLGRGRIGPINVAVIVLVIALAVFTYVLNGTTVGRYVYAVGGNEEAASLSGIRTGRIKVLTFALSGLASGVAGAIAVSRIASGQPQAGAGLELEAVAAVILGGTSIYGGEGAVWRSAAGVMLLALIQNGFNILNANPFYKDLTTGLVIVLAVALSAGRKGR
ncbi:ABC transporter permease [Euzebya rosea]|uniref:ABC transporter permease n=1 Tax=Euzebya rosea TaxID=2052804 RepID=UPI001475D521|nr:ABC transporter permease [Euzebya rosea]